MLAVQTEAPIARGLKPGLDRAGLALTLASTVQTEAPIARGLKRFSARTRYQVGIGKGSDRSPDCQGIETTVEQPETGLV